MFRAIKVELTIVLLATTLLSGCSLNPTGLHHTQSENKEIEIVGTTAGVRGILLRKKSSESVYCSEPQPDASVSESMSENIAASQSGAGNESEGASETAGESSLGGRSVNVLITREIFYRTCEFLANSDLASETKLAVFNASLLSIIKLNTTDLGKGTSNQSYRESDHVGTTIKTTVQQDSDEDLNGN